MHAHTRWHTHVHTHIHTHTQTHTHTHTGLYAEAELHESIVQSLKQTFDADCPSAHEQGASEITSVGVETTTSPHDREEKDPEHAFMNNLEQLEYSAISTRSAIIMPSVLEKTRAETPTLRHAAASTGNGAEDSVDVEMLLHNLGDISLAKKAPKLKAHERQLQVILSPCPDARCR